ncbi:MAG: T9SS type A sorting domain-containing protein [Bacteroidales bacterium]|nr:T9SS type A sorting domain-containing protein [Bacteroidales bacterium]
MPKLKPIILLLLLSIQAMGQEVVTGLYVNPALTKQSVATKGTSDTISLPFIDDFSYSSIYPDNRLWTDNYVFINNTYSKDQPTVGVATFDILNANGKIYNNISAYGFEADRLTSSPIDLNYPASDSIMLSFFYEAGGLGDKPEASDNLVLHFYSPSENRWEEVWSNESVNFDGFRPVVIPITEAKYLQKGFQFRFVNYGSLNGNLSEPSMIGNCDQWNIDYVKLDRGRSVHDTIINDVAFRHPNRSLLKSYEAMPWRQFKEVSLLEMSPNISISYRNNDTITRNVTRQFEITELLTNNVEKSFTGGASNISPMTNVDYEVGHFYSFSNDNDDSARFLIKSWLVTDDFDRKSNDTISYQQVFTNYFAYDDGSAENGYGLNGLGSANAMAALRYRSYIQDTIYAISIYFNDSYQDANQVEFNIMIWDDNGGVPNNVLLELDDCTVQKGIGLTGFRTYMLPEPIAINGVFHIGWKQISETFINVGLDVNTEHGDKQHFWINGNWNESNVNGTIMLRPIMGIPLATGIEDVLDDDVNDEKPTKKMMSFYPTPSTSYIRIETNGFNTFTDYISLYDMTGKEVLREHLTDYLDISRLKAGIYVICINRNGFPIATNKLLKSK